MNHKAVIRSLGIVLLAEAAFMLPSLLISLYYRQGDASAFLVTIFILASIGLPLYRIKLRKRGFYARDGFAIVALGWMAMSFFGAFPFYFSGAIASPVDALFESISGFTTTGASILNDIESLPRGILFWRSFTHWIGGMGVLLLTLAILPLFGSGAVHILRAESPGPSPGKLVPKIGQTAKLLYGIYLGFTALQVLALGLAGMSLYDALIHTFGTAGTGGFSNYNQSVGAFNSPAIDIIIGVFMLLFGISFALHYQLLRGNWKAILKDEEFKFYGAVTIISVALISFNIWEHSLYRIGEGTRHAFFQVASIITTTGYSTTDFDQWPVLSKAILVTLMLLGPCAGSTGGGIKSIRILILFKTIRKELVKVKHPQSVHTVKINGMTVADETLSGITAFVFFYLIILVFAVLLVSHDAQDLKTAFTSVVACLSNIGPGLSVVGPAGNYASFSPLSKSVLSLCMIIGRLEIFPVMLLFLPSFWRRVSI